MPMIWMDFFSDHFLRPVFGLCLENAMWKMGVFVQHRCLRCLLTSGFCLYLMYVIIIDENMLYIFIYTYHIIIDIFDI